MRVWRLGLVSLLSADGALGLMSSTRKLELRELTRDTWLHAFRSYRRLAYPSDEVLPLSCKPQGRDKRNSENLEVNDVMGSYSLTLVDALDSFAVLGDHAGFETAVRETIASVSFDVNSRVQVFEVTIRMMGGLLAGHQLASSTSPHGFSLKWYKGELLTLARDLGRRLLPAFNTSTGIPYARIHLQHGVRKAESRETCTAGAGSLMLEFGTLSRLTGDPVFEKVARRAYMALWTRRSPLDLVGNTITIDGDWVHAVSSTGAGIDSFFEYSAKSYVLFGEDEWWRVWDDSYAAIQRHIRAPDGFWYRGVGMQSGVLSTIVVDSLSAFFPGVQVLVGELEAAIKSHMVFANQWLRYSALPETFDINSRRAVSMGYPLRPEFIESNLFLYRATKDEWYLELAERVLHDLNNLTRVECGMAALLNVETGQLEDKQPSFLTSETLKYLYLTFDEHNPFNTNDANSVFSTEGHLLTADARPVAGRRRGGLPSPSPTCPAYDPTLEDRHLHFLSTSISTRTDFEHARHLVGYEVDDEREIREGRWSENGFCEIPVLEDYNIELLFGDQEDLSPRASKVWQDDAGVLHISEIAGLRFSLKRAPGGFAFVVSRVGPYRVPPGSFVLLRDPAVLALVAPPPVRKVLLKIESNRKTLRLPGFASSFGPSVASVAAPTKSFALNQRALPLVISPPPFHFGCEPYQDVAAISGKVLLLRRGLCSFAVKSNMGALGGAKAIIVVNGAGEEDVVPSASGDEVEPGSKLKALVPLVLVGNTTGAALVELLAEGHVATIKLEASIADEIEPIVLGGYTVLNVRMKRS